MWHGFVFFSGRGKRTVWDTCGQFASLMNKPQLGDADAAMDTLEICCTPVGQIQQQKWFKYGQICIFAWKDRYMKNIPPTQGTFLQHARRVTYQAGHCWIQTTGVGYALMEGSVVGIKGVDALVSFSMFVKSENALSDSTLLNIRYIKYYLEKKWPQQTAKWCPQLYVARCKVPSEL